MNGTQTALAIGLCVLACISTCILVWHMAYKDGYNAGREYETSRQYWKLIRERRETERPQATYGGSDGRPPWYVDVSRKTVSVPAIPLTTLLGSSPQTMAAVPSMKAERATDTGELRALTAATDLYVDRMAADGEAYRQEMNA